MFVFDKKYKRNYRWIMCISEIENYSIGNFLSTEQINCNCM